MKMKYRYKGKEGIEALRLKRIDEKQAQKPKRIFKFGIISRLVEEMKLPGKSRKEKREQAKVFLKDPLKYNSDNIGRTLTRRGRFWGEVNG